MLSKLENDYLALGRRLALYLIVLVLLSQTHWIIQIINNDNEDSCKYLGKGFHGHSRQLELSKMFYTLLLVYKYPTFFYTKWTLGQKLWKKIKKGYLVSPFHFFKNQFIHFGGYLKKIIKNNTYIFVNKIFFFLDIFINFVRLIKYNCFKLIIEFH